MNEIDPELLVIIAEDDDAAAHLIKTNLKRAGISGQFIRAKNGEELLEHLEGRRGDIDALINNKLIVLLDIRMPVMDGIQALKHMKSSEELKMVPVFMFTTSDRSEEVKTCYELGCNSYIRKQVDYSKFVESIRNLAAFILTCEIPIFGETTHA